MGCGKPQSGGIVNEFLKISKEIIALKPVSIFIRCHKFNMLIYDKTKSVLLVWLVGLA